MAINNHIPTIDLASNTHLPWTRANSNMPHFRGPAASSNGQGNRRQFVEISYIESMRICIPFYIKLIV
jgi:hypothetical protein